MSKAEQRRRCTVCDTVVAEWAGLTLHELHVLHPADFGSPRDFRWDGLHYCYTSAGLGRLRTAIRDSGQPLAADRLAPLIERLDAESTTPAGELGLRACA